VIKFDHYYYKEDDQTKVFFSLDWFVFEDRWTQRYMFDRPMWKDEEMEEIRLRNLNRHRWFTVRFNIMGYRIHFELRLNKIGNLYYGRQLDDNPKQSPLKRRKQQ
jgi:hypothetical protein